MLDRLRWYWKSGQDYGISDLHLVMAVIQGAYAGHVGANVNLRNRIVVASDEDAVTIKTIDTRIDGLFSSNA